MENCLVTKLKGSVSADLEKFDVFTLVVAPNVSNYDIEIKNFAGQVMNWDGDVTITLTDGTPITKPYSIPGGWARVSSGVAGGTIDIKSKKMVNNNSGNTGLLVDVIYPKYCTTLNSLSRWWIGTLSSSFTDLSGYLSDIKDFVYLDTIDIIYLNSNNITGDLSDLPATSNVINFQVAHTGVVGNITSLGGWTTLTRLTVEYTAVGGTVEDFIAAQRAAGRTTGSIAIYAYNSGVTYNGAGFNNQTFTWDVQGNITVS